MTGDRYERLVHFFKDLVRCPSLSGQERNLATHLRKAMLDLGYDRAEVDGYGNVIGIIRFGNSARRILMDSQMDHVGIGDPNEWIHYPYEAIQIGNRIYGRGTTDQKGSLAAMVMAGAALKEKKPEGLNGELLVAGTVQQEEFEGEASALLAKKYRPDAVVINEATSLNVERGQRGRAEIIIQVHGKMTHSAHPDMGVNAPAKMIKILGTLESSFVPPVDVFFGKGHLVLTDIVSLPRHGTTAIPDRCTATLDRRVMGKETKEIVIGQIQKIIDALTLLDPAIDAQCSISSREGRTYRGIMLRCDHFIPAWETPVESSFLGSAINGIKEHLGEVVLSPQAGFGTSGHVYSNLGIPIVVFGPSRKDLLHVVDEYIEIDQLIGAMKGYYGIANSFLNL